MEKKVLPADFEERLTNAITDHVFKMPDDATEDHVVVNDKFEIEFVPIKNQIEKPWHRIGTVGSLYQNVPLMGGIRIAEVDNEVYEIDDGLGYGDRAALAQKYPEGDFKRTFIDSSFRDKAGLIEWLKKRGLKQRWYERMLKLTKVELGLYDEDEGETLT